MAEAECELIEVRWINGGLGGLLHIPSAIQPAPGQYLLGTVPELDELLPTSLFRTGRNSSSAGDVLEISPPLPQNWAAGMQVHVRGPLGRGFMLPPQAQAVALAVVDQHSGRVIPLLWQALKQGAAVALYSDDRIDDIPNSVEVLPLSLLPEALSWAHYLAIDMPAERAEEWRSLLGLPDGVRSPFPVELLLQVDMPCGARAACGVCSIRTQNGWQLICRDGPVFPAAEIR